MAVNDKVKISDYNAIQAKVSKILGNGVATYGWGQPTASTVHAGSKTSASKWDDLKHDLQNIYRHNNGSLPSLADVSHGDKIRYAATEPLIQYDNFVDSLSADRFKIHATRAKTVNKGSNSAVFPGIYGAYWSEKVECTVTYNFSTSNDARHFFNSGGKIRFSSTRTGGSSTSQNDAWSRLLNTIGTIEFGIETLIPTTFYDLTSSYQQIFQQASSGIYSYMGCELIISAKCDVANNVSGTARTLYFFIEWIDTYGDNTYVDGVDGTLSIHSNTLEATGQFVQGGNFTVESPGISFSSFTVS